MSVVPIRSNFENMKALLACIAEDPQATGFAGVVFRNDNSGAVPVTFNCDRKEVAFASVMLQALALEPAE